MTASCRHPIDRSVDAPRISAQNAGMLLLQDAVVGTVSFVGCAQDRCWQLFLKSFSQLRYASNSRKQHEDLQELRRQERQDAWRSGSKAYRHVLNVTSRSPLAGWGGALQLRASGLAVPTGRPKTVREELSDRQKSLEEKRLPPQSGNPPIVLGRPGLGSSRLA